VSAVQSVTILGSTGSIGESTLAVIAKHPERYRVTALVAKQQDEILARQCLAFNPAVAVLEDEAAARRLRERLGNRVATEVRSGREAVIEVAGSVGDTVMAAIVGAAGLEPTLASVSAGKRVLLANKEALVMSGQLLLERAQRSGGQLLPIDSEHNAIFQCLPAGRSGQTRAGVRRLWLTASGGPFLRSSMAQLKCATPEQAINHPKWQMGAKISVDSATLMNKGLELIEAVLLFGMTPAQVDVVIHPESIVHSLVEYIDGSTLAQLGYPDMRVPIAHALAYPDRVESGVAGLDLLSLGSLNFEKPDHERFPSLSLCAHAARLGQSAPTLVNAANEVAVAAFLARQLNFMDIPRVIDSVLSQLVVEPLNDLKTVLAVDNQARTLATQIIKTHFVC